MSGLIIGLTAIGAVAGVTLHRIIALYPESEAPIMLLLIALLASIVLMQM